ncbi:MAG: fluoride efflux transporter CrcB [Desulfovibrionales bacterium]|nr:MAG: fluoride efflux transporter CrcB [Desulfovibrionales bacterium]
MYELLLFCLAAAFGAMARYGLSVFVYGLLGRNFPWGTAVVNVLGSFLFGLIWMLTDGIEMSAQVRVILLVGFLGSFTTFSTYIFESHLLLQQGKRLYVLLNVIGQTLIGLAALSCGFLLGSIW